MIRLLCILLSLSMARAASEPLKTLAEVRALSAEEAAKGLPVLVEGIAIVTGFQTTTMIIHDGVAGCHVTAMPGKDFGNVQPGSRVRVKGVSRPISFFPDIEGAEIISISPGELPEPRKVSLADLSSRSVDSEWVEVESVVVATETGDPGYTLVIEVGGQPFKAYVPNHLDADKLAAALMQKKVRLRGVIGSLYNENRQLTGRFFLIPSFDQIIPFAPALSEAPPPLRLIRSLLQNDHETDQLVKLHGVITSPGIGGFYMRDESGSTFVRAAQGEVHPPGQEVEAVGFAAVATFRPIFRATRVKPLGRSEIPSPVDFDPEKEEYWSSLHHELVRVSCELVSQRDSSTDTILQCRIGGIFFEATFAKGAAPVALQPGDQLALTGILEAATSRPMLRYDWVDGFRMHLAGPQAVTVTRKAPWWTTDRILITLGIATAVILLVFGWNWLLRQRVARQAAIISRQNELGVVKDERDRIARELHDTLEQELTGLSMQLGNVAAEIGAGDDPVRHRLRLAQQMLQHCRLEARASVSDLRDPNLLVRDLPEALRESLNSQVNKTGTHLDFSVAGSSVHLRATTQNHLLRIAREAVSNALRHGKASQIRCHLTYSAEGVALEIEDNGGGFDASQLAPVGHFGLIGMAERANKIQAQFSLTSSPGSGTKIRLYLPYSSPEALPRLRKHP
jgi:signal transduction histidine kinase